ncbi:ribosome recycling factor [Bimuria novae-zelandiae CBS 107.79]|uniref:Ribosome recycling factor n=1 Tax=Bimuria novae-zelandiae CBS 107.79 TaxID=1447943 RepID=A0A6A5VPJ6_9PLEO|nr:ribosome recycling factor [Bimuria novae-zelandiae CBS 107.79]
MSHPLLPRAALRLSSNSPLLTSTRAFASPQRKFFPRTTCGRRTFTTTPTLHKKAGKANKAHARTDSSPPISKAGTSTATDDAYDLSTVEAEILKAIEQLTHRLSQLRGGGRLAPEVVEGLKVQLGSTGKDGGGKETVRLGDVAQVVPRGRVLNVIVGEAEHIKPVSTAIAASPHSLTPLTPEASNPLTIQVPLPPPTGETRRAAIDKAGQAAEVADKWIQKARQNHNQKLRKYQLDKSVLPDDLQKAGKRMEEVVKKGHAEVKRIVDGAKKVLEAL